MRRNRELHERASRTLRGGTVIISFIVQPALRRVISDFGYWHYVYNAL